MLLLPVNELNIQMRLNNIKKINYFITNTIIENIHLNL